MQCLKLSISHSHSCRLIVSGNHQWRWILMERGGLSHVAEIALLWVLATSAVCFLQFLQLSERARERKVPVTRIGRLANFGGEWFFVVQAAWRWIALKRLEVTHSCTVSLNYTMARKTSFMPHQFSKDVKTDCQRWYWKPLACIYSSVFARCLKNNL